MATRVEIPQGFMHRRLFAFVQLELALPLLAMPIVLFEVWSGLAALLALPLISVLWFFAAYHTKRDENWLDKWAWHLNHKNYYRS